MSPLRFWRSRDQAASDKNCYTDLRGMLMVLDNQKPSSLEPTLTKEVVFPPSPTGCVHTGNLKTFLLLFDREEI